MAHPPAADHQPPIVPGLTTLASVRCLGGVVTVQVVYAVWRARQHRSAYLALGPERARLDHAELTRLRDGIDLALQGMQP